MFVTAASQRSHIELLAEVRPITPPACDIINISPILLNQCGSNNRGVTKLLTIVTDHVTDCFTSFSSDASYYCIVVNQ